MQKITDAEADNPNNVKVVIDKNNKSLLFSRAKIPFNRDKEIKANYWLHIGVYAYRKDTLIRFSKLAQTPLEKIEKLENLRLLENGIPIHMIETFNNGIKIDVPEDLEAAKDFYNKNFK